jgi:hypothetical protein
VTRRIPGFTGWIAWREGRRRSPDGHKGRTYATRQPRSNSRRESPYQVRGGRRPAIVPQVWQAGRPPLPPHGHEWSDDAGADRTPILAPACPRSAAQRLGAAPRFLFGLRALGRQSAVETPPRGDAKGHRPAALRREAARSLQTSAHDSPHRHAGDALIGPCGRGYVEIAIFPDGAEEDSKPAGEPWFFPDTDRDRPVGLERACRR